MKIVCIGGGPASLYFALLQKKRQPDWQIQVFERNPRDVTWGFGVVFSDETMENFKEIDRPTYEAITGSFVHWDDIDTFVKGGFFRSTGHGFAGMQRLKLLQILEARAIELGVEVQHEVDVASLDAFADADLIVAGDGVNSSVRSMVGEETFGTDIEWRPNKFVWFGTDRPFDAFTFYFNENEHGLWRAHCYQYLPGHSTFIVECTEDAWRRAGLENATEAESIAYCEKVYEKELEGHSLISNRSVWRSFPRVKNKRYFHDKVVLVGDALHTAHFSIGSGTKLAMEDAIALSDAIEAHGVTAGLPAALQAFQNEREPVVNSTQRAAQVSMEWFEETERYHDVQAPIQFTYGMLTRSLRINHDNLRLRDPEFVAQVERWFEDQVKADGAVAASSEKDAKALPPLFQPFTMRGLTLPNRIVLSPMCMYSAVDGVVSEFHLVHLGSRAIGGAGLIYSEMTCVAPDARITEGCAGIWNDEQVQAWRRINDFVHQHSKAKTCLQLGHAGRKGSTKLPWEGHDAPLETGGWDLIAPSAIPFKERSHTPKEMDEADMQRVKEEFTAAVRNGVEAGFDMCELHCAHGYLFSTFLSPLTNHRSDDYGGSIANRMRFPLRVFRAMREVWPADRPMAVRISATDWKDGGFSDEDALAFTKALAEAGCDLVDVSAGQVVADQRPQYGRLFQTPFSTKLRLDSGMATMTVGNIQSFGDANAILAGGRADLCALARMHLADPYWTRHAAYEYGVAPDWPLPYQAVERYTPRWS